MNLCGNDEFWIFGSDEREGYIVACTVCHRHQRKLMEEMGLPYLWKEKDRKGA